MAVAYKKELDYPLENFRKMFLDLKKGEYFGRLGKTFKTDKNFYFIDTGTGKIAQLEEHVYLVLKTLFENDSFDALYELEMDEQEITDALETIEQGVEHEHILSAPIIEKMVGAVNIDLERPEHFISSNVTLELTEECNLRCKYCFYHPSHPEYRDFSKKHMSWETAKQAIDFLYKQSRNQTEPITIGFYGGEPLLNFEVLKSSINYAKKRFKGEKIGHNITTNAVLLTSEISDYLVENDVTILVSLDGPKVLHDENRIFSNGGGSFDSVRKGIENLVQSFKKLNKDSLFTINIVTSNVGTQEKYDLVYNFLESCEWIPKEVSIMCNGINRGLRKSAYVLPQSEDEKALHAQMKDLLGMWSDVKSKDYIAYEPDFSEYTVNQMLVRIHKRLLSDKPSNFYSLNGCCVPGQRKLYVTVDGDFFPCEQVGTEIPKIGNINTGLNLKNIKRYYIDEYGEKSKEYCKNCWASHMCAICYTNCYKENGIDVDYKHSLCESERFFIEANLIRYHKMLENNPAIVEKFNEIELA